MTKRDAVDVAADGPCETPMSDHVERFFQMLEGGTVRILVDTEQWHSASFPDDAAKAIAAAYRSASNSGAEAFRSAVKMHIREEIEATRKACDAAWAEYTPELGLHAINVYEALLVSIDAAIPLPAPGAPASPWRDMETAPKTGDEIDVWVGGEFPRRVPDVSWRKPTDSEWWVHGGDTIETADPAWHDCFGPLGKEGQPVAWMPRPTPPASKDT